eukprot:scaffold16809_cov77-Phaeocystis_antarctica.AAC.1
MFDALGDVAQSDGEAGHQTRHFLINHALYDAFRQAYGGQVRREPDNCMGYSDHRPDLALLLDGELTVFDLKVFSTRLARRRRALASGAGTSASATRRSARTTWFWGGAGAAPQVSSTGAPGRAT